ncbi:MAG: ATP-binding protein [bacterium]
MAEDTSSASPSGHDPTDDDALVPDPSRKIVYLMFFRTTLITVLFGVILAVGLLSQRPFRLTSVHSQAMFLLVIFAYACSLLYAVLFRHVRRKRRFFAVQAGVDVLLVSVLVHLTGGVNSVYSFLFPLLIIEATIVYFRRGALVAGVAVVVAFISVTVGGWIQFLPPIPDQVALPWQATPNELARYLILNVGGQICIAVLASFLAEQLRRADLRVAEQRLTIRDMVRLNENILQSLHTGLITVDNGGQVLSVNRAASLLLQRSQNRLTARSIREVLPGLDRIGSAEEPSRHRTTIDRGEEGDAIPVEVTVSPLWNREDRRAGSVLLIEDLTEISAMEDRVKRAERLAAVGRLAAGVAHEIRNPLASVSGSLELLRTADAATDDDRRLIGIAIREVERLDALVSDLLAYARPRSLQRMEFDLATMAQEVASACAQDPSFHGITVEVSTPDGPCTLMADHDQLRQVFWNIYRNGAEAMAEGGMLRVTVSRPEAPEPAGVQIRVTDTGPGIPPDKLGHIFEPFFTTKDRGTGLGLATVYRIVEDHRGHVEVESNYDEGGTTMTVLIPDTTVAPDPDEPPEPAGTGAPPDTATP